MKRNGQLDFMTQTGGNNETGGNNDSDQDMYRSWWEQNLWYKSNIFRSQTSLREINIHEVLSCDSSTIFIHSEKCKFPSLNQCWKIRKKSKFLRDMHNNCHAQWLMDVLFWPASSISDKPVVVDFVEKFKLHVQEKLLVGDAYLISRFTAQNVLHDHHESAAKYFSSTQQLLCRLRD